MNIYLGEVRYAIQGENGSRLSKLLSLEDNHVRTLSRQYQDSVLDETWSQIVHFHVLAHFASTISETIQYQIEFLKTFNHIYNSLDNWIIPVVRRSVTELRKLVITEYRKTKDKANVKLASSCIEQVFNETFSCRRSKNSLREGLLFVVNNLIILHDLLRTNTFKELSKRIDNANIDFRTQRQYGKADLVTYHHYRGCMELYAGNFEISQENLSYAFRNCTSRCPRNKRMILIYLIPLQLLKDHAPTQYLLKKYNLGFFQDIITSVRQGNITLYQKAMAENEVFFINKGIYIIMEKLRLSVYRHLFRRVWLIMGKNHIMSISAFQKALELFGQNIDTEECECILANLIYSQKIKGYLHHQQQKIVFSKTDAFPLKSVTG